MASEPVEPYFTRFLRVLTFCLGVSKIVKFCGNGVVNGVVETTVEDEERTKIRDGEGQKNLIRLNKSGIIMFKPIQYKSSRQGETV